MRIRSHQVTNARDDLMAFESSTKSRFLEVCIQANNLKKWIRLKKMKMYVNIAMRERNCWPSRFCTIPEPFRPSFKPVFSQTGQVWHQSPVPQCWFLLQQKLKSPHVTSTQPWPSEPSNFSPWRDLESPSGRAEPGLNALHIDWNRAACLRSPHFYSRWLLSVSSRVCKLR